MNRRALRTLGYLAQHSPRTQASCSKSFPRGKIRSLHRPNLYLLPTHRAQFSTKHAMNKDPAHRFDPHAYTSGRWLRRDKQERDLRYIEFNFDALCRRVIELCPGAKSIVTYDKKEGGFNRVFIFTLDNATRVVAKLPFAMAGPPKLTTTSEVATIKYLQAKTAIPIPEILDWSNDASNVIGSEYIIMEHATGVHLHEKWPSMSADQKIRCIDAIYQKVKEMVYLEFPAYGSLYFVDSTLNCACKQLLDKEFCIGPHCGSRYWDCNTGEPRYYHNAKPNHGPWTDLEAYCDGLIDTGLSRIPPPVDPELERRHFYYGSVQTHLSLLECGRAVLKEMSVDPRIRDSATPTLFHPDLHKRNIFVSDHDPSIITGIIDWQSSSIEPAFWYADEVPDFARRITQPSRDNIERDSELCAKAFEVCTQFLVPKLSGPRLMDESLFRPFRYCYRTWKDGAVAFRHELIETSQNWKELGFTGSCPYPIPTPKELAVHQKEYRCFEAAQNLRRDLSNLLNTASDGWVPPEVWEATESAHREMFNGMLQAVLTNEDPDPDEPIKDEGDLRVIWPFDI